MKDWCGTAFCGAFFGGVDSWHVFVIFFRLRWNWLISTISLRILGSFYILGLYPFSSHSVFTPQNGFPPHFWIDQKTRIFLHVHCPTGKHKNTALGLPENDNTPPNHPHLSLPSKNCTQGSCLSQRTNRLATWSLSNKENPFVFVEQKRG